MKVGEAGEVGEVKVGEAGAARGSVVAMGLRLLSDGLVARTWGNASVRLNARFMAITPSGRAYDSMAADDIAIVDLESGEWSGWATHAGALRLAGLHMAERMAREMVTHMRDLNMASLRGSVRDQVEYSNKLAISIPDWLQNND